VTPCRKEGLRVWECAVIVPRSVRVDNWHLRRTCELSAVRPGKKTGTSTSPSRAGVLEACGWCASHIACRVSRRVHRLAVCGGGPPLFQQSQKSVAELLREMRELWALIELWAGLPTRSHTATEGLTARSRIESCRVPGVMETCGQPCGAVRRPPHNTGRSGDHPTTRVELCWQPVAKQDR
jgi:hypothetical protein